MASGPQREMQAAEPPLTVRRWSMTQWREHAHAWEALTARAATDPLFLSWEWLSSWWNVFGDTLGAAPEVVAFYRASELVGLAPLYRQRVLRNGFLPAQSLQVMGLAWRDPEPLISEYLDVIGAQQDLTALREACVRHLLADPDWSEFVIGFSAVGAQWREAFERCAGSERHYVREWTARSRIRRTSQPASPPIFRTWSSQHAAACGICAGAWPRLDRCNARVWPPLTSSAVSRT